MGRIFTILTQLRPEVELGVGLLIALAVSVHVLLTNSEVRVAAAWIGLAWFAPFIGGPVYVLFGINRVQRRARRLRAGVAEAIRDRSGAAALPGQNGRLEALRRSLDVITGRPLTVGNAVQVLHNGDEAYPAMLAAIDAARGSIGLSSYIMRDDAIGTRFIEALQAARARGVEVRVIVDGVGSGWLVSPAFTHLRRAGVPVERFMHSALPWRMPFLNLRSHKKILVIDGAIGFTGGINIADQNVLATNPPDPVQDTHFRLTGPVVAQLVEAFAQDWLFVNGEMLDGPAWFPSLSAAGAAPARVATAGPDEDVEKIEIAVLQAITCAETSIRVMTPYFLPDQPLILALSLAATRGVQVDILLPERGDHRLVEWAMLANVAPLLRAGGRIWRSPQPFRHSKAMVVDSAWSLIGSSNWDMRSFRLNFELCVEVYGPGLARDLEAAILQSRGAGLDIAELRARGVLTRLRDAATRLLLPYL